MLINRCISFSIGRIISAIKCSEGHEVIYKRSVHFQLIFSDCDFDAAVNSDLIPDIYYNYIVIRVTFILLSDVNGRGLYLALVTDGTYSGWDTFQVNIPQR